MKQSRLDQLSDGIFAIVMTILVFEIRVPIYAGVVSEQTLINSLINIYPLLLSYMLSFSLLFTYWRSHHIIASVLAKNIDVQFTNLSGIFLFLVALVPFSSDFLGRHIYSKTGVIFFALNIILIGISLYKMRQYAIKSETIENTPFTNIENEHANMHILFPIISALVSIVVAFYSTKIAILLFTISILFNLSKNGTRYMFYIINIFRNKKEKVI
ncbi:MAG: TMEM175 family protein [Candidatus Paceibacterota bacterium]